MIQIINANDVNAPSCIISYMNSIRKSFFK